MARIRQLAFVVVTPFIVAAAVPSPRVRAASREEVIAETMVPYSGPSVTGVDVSTLTGKVMCGYQGWFGAEGDGLGRGWYHWSGGGRFEPGSCKIDLWPDVSELDPDERYPTAFRHADGRPAEVYSAFNRKTVVRHFQWMEDYGIDGVFVQRFGAEVSHPAGLRQFTTVLGHCREGANRHGRAYAVMYDLSGLRAGGTRGVIEDWKLLVDRMQIAKDPAYLRHGGKPVVAVWGVGFSDGRRYTLEECLELVRFLKEDPAHGGCTVMVGVPTYWRTLERDSVKDPRLHDVIRAADIISPWTVGRFGAPEAAARYAATTAKGDIAWCGAERKEYLPVVFPGFSWHNMNPGSPLDQIPRLEGRFLWAQYAALRTAGATMVYQAMFDEVDEGTAIFKCTNDPPVGASRFVTYGGLPSDHYLRLVGRATLMVRGDAPVTEAPPEGAGAAAAQDSPAPARPAAGAEAASAPGPDAFEQVRRMGRGVNAIGYDPLWKDASKARFRIEHFGRIREAGFSHVRINLHPFRDARPAADGTIRDSWWKALDWAVDGALAAGLRVVLDFHEFTAMARDPEGKKASFLAIWSAIAERQKDRPDGVIFEILNEPNGELTPEKWNGFLAEALAAIRRSNPTRTVIVGPGQWNGIGSLEKLRLPPEDRNIIVTVHYYGPFEFTHQGTPWTDRKDRTGIKWTGTPEEVAAIARDFDRVAAWASREKRPLYLGEFGAYEKGDMDSRVRWTSAVAREAERRGWSWAYWQFDGDFIVYDIPRDRWVEPIRDALIPEAETGAKPSE